MSKKTVLLAIIATTGGALLFAVIGFARGQATEPSALDGQVRSKEEGAMEGVLVTARRNGSTIAVTVVSDGQGHYAFPRTKLDPGQYSLSIRAVGYDADPIRVEIAPLKTARADVNLLKTQDLASQLTNAEWLMSMPGDERKTYLLNCVNCHTLQRIVRSHHDATEFTHVMQRMSGYYPGASPLLPQRVPAFDRNPEDLERFRQPAEFASTINLSKVSKWEYPLKTLPRPKGRSTHVIITEYSLPREVSQPHDVIVDSDGMAWYGDFGQQYIGKLDPKTGKVTEYPVPELKPDQPRGGLELQQDKDGNIWFGLQFQGGIAKFDKKSQKFQMFPLPKELDSDKAQVAMVNPEHLEVDGKVWMKDAGSARSIVRVDLASGQFQAFNPFLNRPGHNAYGITTDSRNNLYFMEVRSEYIGRVDAKTGEATAYRTPTRDSGPRRGHMDSQDRLWFAEYRGNRVAMFDPRTEQFQEWPLPSPWTSPYDAVLDKNGEAWAGGMSNDRIVRVNTKSGQVTEYLLPQETNVRRVFVDNSTTPVTFWVGNDHHASIVKVEPLD